MNSYGSSASSSLRQDTKAKITQSEAEEAIKVLIEYLGDNPNREGLIDTPKRVIKSFKEFYSGYDLNGEEILSRTFEDVEGYDDIVMLKNINFESHCEHHMVPIIGRATIGYYPDKRVVGISKLARVLDVYAKRLQTQEKL